MQMADKKENCGCGCTGKKQDKPAADSGQKKPRKSA
jgi:hypothetical protein